MTCERCGSRCQGRRCAACEQMEHLEDYYGTPAEVMERREAMEDDNE